ncbi:MAG: PTS sugar transporter subunit IIB [Syntrophobacterales bacterium]|jgi:PTS system mannose-specific IIB component|nr:PTS sugar transporter subunit IIB [Syntrophobacterales bacterium]
MPFNISLVRVDNRLVHGQILEAWLPFTGASSIIIPNDSLASDMFRETVMRMALPRDIELYTWSLNDFQKLHQLAQDQNRKVLILFADIQDAFKAYEKGFLFTTLNIGNVHSDPSVISCSPSVFLNEEDIGLLVQLSRGKGVRIDIRRVPKEKPADFRPILKHYSD